MVTRVGKFLGGLDADVTDVLKVHTTENMICIGADSTPAANLAVVGNAFISTNLVVNQGLGAVGNTAPATTDVSLGTPANVVIRTHAASGAGNVIIGDATATSAFNLDVHGTANVGVFTGTSGTFGLGLGLAGNTAPIATALSIGTPANVVVRTFAATGVANVIVGDATATSGYNLDVRGTANTGALTASGLAYPTSDGTEDYVLATDGSGALSWVEQTGTSNLNPATVLSANKDLGAVGGSETADAFGVIITDDIIELDCGLYAADTLGTVDMGSVA